MHKIVYREITYRADGIIPHYHCVTNKVAMPHEESGSVTKYVYREITYRANKITPHSHYVTIKAAKPLDIKNIL